MISETWKDENCTVFLTNVLRAQHPSKLSAAAPPVTNLQRCTALQIGMLEWGEMYTYPVLLAWWSLAESFPAHPAVALGKTLRPFYRKASFRDTTARNDCNNGSPVDVVAVRQIELQWLSPPRVQWGEIKLKRRSGDISIALTSLLGSLSNCFSDFIGLEPQTALQLELNSSLRTLWLEQAPSLTIWKVQGLAYKSCWWRVLSLSASCSFLYLFNSSG